jgi:hypothetical protein
MGEAGVEPGLLIATGLYLWNGTPDRQVFWNFLMVNRLLTACCALWPERCSCF